MNPSPAVPPPAAREDMPTRWQSLLFLGKAMLFRLRRALRDPAGRRPRALPHAEAGDTPVLGESHSALFPSDKAAEFALQAGKVQNLRVAAQYLDGRLLRAGELFSFWAHVPRPTASGGFAPGRELREGCVIPSVGGGLCQISNALYDAALKAGFEIVERHAHSRRLPGSMAAAGRDATIFWNYVDLRFRAPVDCVLEVKLTRWEMIVRFRQATPDGAANTPVEAPRPTEPHSEKEAAESCETCGITSCFRNPAATSLPQKAVTAWLVDVWSPEFDAYLAGHRTAHDHLLLPLDSRRWRIGPYRWNSTGFARVHHSPWFVLQRSLRSRRLAHQGPARQKALLAMDAMLAADFARRIPHTALHLVVSQNLLPFLWKAGVLAGRSYDVLMTRLPLSALQAQLDAAAVRWPDAAMLSDFRADPELVRAEDAALTEARHWITPHSAIARLACRREEKLAWHLPKAAPRSPGSRVVFPASTLGRKGALELRDALRSLKLPLTLVGPVLEGTDFWNGVDAESAGEDWLADAAVVVLPAWVEHQPRRLLAAVAAGIPVIASTACGLEGVAGVTIIPEGDVEALVVALKGCA